MSSSPIRPCRSPSADCAATESSAARFSLDQTANSGKRFCHPPTTAGFRNPPFIPLPTAIPTEIRNSKFKIANNVLPLVPIICTRRLATFHAVKNINLTLRYGEIFGLLGANGAGKTTTIKMLCGLLPPSQGDISLAGQTQNLEAGLCGGALAI